MSLWLHVHGGYPSYEALGLEWGPLDYDAYKLVQALKGGSVHGYATLKRPNGQWIKIEGDKTEPAFQLFGEWGAAKLQQLGLTSGHLVPVPSSTCLSLASDAKGRRLANAIASRHPGFEVLEALHWHEQLPKSAEGGPRDPKILLENLRILQNLPKGTIVLVDDVITTGGHLRASAEGLRYFGGSVGHALCAAQTCNDRPKAMFSIASRDLEV